MNLQKIMAEHKYPVMIQHIDDEEGGYWFAYLPDFGHSACSAPGDTIEDALELLEEVRMDVVELFRENGIELPKPSCDPMVDLWIKKPYPPESPIGLKRRLEISRYTRVFEATPHSAISATIKEFPGCCAEGDTFLEANRNLTVTANAWMDGCIASGVEIPKSPNTEEKEKL